MLTVLLVVCTKILTSSSRFLLCSGCQALEGWGRDEDVEEIFRAVEVLVQHHNDGYLSLSMYPNPKNVHFQERTAVSAVESDSDVSCRFISDKEYTTLGQDIESGRGYACVWEGDMGNLCISSSISL